jgi:hypothetical protein
MRRQGGFSTRQFVFLLCTLGGLVLLIMYTMGLELITQTEGTKLLAYAKQIEQANQSFHTKMRAWPHEAIDDPSPEHSVLALVDPTILKGNYAEKGEAILEAAEVEDDRVIHRFGKGGTILQSVVKEDGRDYILIIFTNVPVATWEQADEKEDGRADPFAGRIQTEDDPGQSPTVTVTYLANRIK